MLSASNFEAKTRQNLTEVRKVEHMACIWKSLMVPLAVLGAWQDSEVGE